jgi:hypothetical protein
LIYGTNNPVELLDIQLGNPSANAQIVPFNGSIDDPLIGTAVRSGSKVMVKVPDSWPFGISWLRVVGVTNSRRKPSVEMTLQVRKGIAVSPQSIFFGSAKVGAESVGMVMVEHASKGFSIEKVEAADGFLATVEKADASGFRHKVTVRHAPKQAGQISGVITLTTNSAIQPTITIPIGGQAG